MKRSFLLCLCLSLLSPVLHAHGVRGLIRGSDGSPLAFASVYVSPANTGTTANQDGRYELNLPAGKYKIRIQNIGYKAQEAELEVTSGWVDKDFVLSPQGYLLQEVAVGKGRKEDFAYTIMRKTIAKKKFHLLQYNSYEMKVYIKGTAELNKVPFFIRSKLKKEGLNLNEAYTTESVSHIRFTQPNKVEERVMAIRTKGKDNSGVSPSMFINQSFYRDKIAGIISPLSNAAFKWYKFTYEGSFTEGSQEVNKIRITPRSRGDNVFEGTIYIIDEQWAIHSLDLKTSIMGFPISLRQNYGEIAPELWLPVSHKYQFEGSVLGFKGSYNYLASCRDYKVELNKDLLFRTEIVDEKIDPAPEERNRAGRKGAAPVDILPPDSKVARKDFYKMMDEYEKKSAGKNKDLLVISDMSFKIDSNAGNRDSSYWSSVRSIPLTVKEQMGYRRDDSLAKIEAVRLSGKDSLKVVRRRSFSPLDLIGGGRYDLSAWTRISIDPTFTQTYFNTVEGYNINVSARLSYSFDSLRRKINFAPAVRYGFSGRDLYARALLSYSLPQNVFALAGGRFIEQFNNEESIHPLVNTFSSLLFKRNYMKIYEKSYLEAGWKYTPSAFFSLKLDAGWARRKQLFNTTDHSYFYRDSRGYTSNAPDNIELSNTGFAQHEAVIFAAAVYYRPIRRYKVYNGRKRSLPDLSPEVSLNYRKGVKDLLGSDVDYDQLEIGLKHGLSIGARDRIEFELQAGSFLNSNSMSFADFRHFDGNRTLLGSMRPAGAFRLLDYYLYSTADKYFSGHLHYGFRKLLLTRIPEVRYRGIRENVFVNYLKTPASPHYFEIGYSLDNVFRVFRLEVASSFSNGKYQETGFRVGIATMFNFNKAE